jgi:predicted transcriptional regulator of viral defense system
MYIFTTADAAALAPPGTSPAQVNHLLKSLTDAGWLTRLRRGLYAGTGRLPGGVDVPPFAIATAMASPSCIALRSALAYHDLTDQVPHVVTVMTPRTVVTPSMRGGAGAGGRHVWVVAGVACRFVTVGVERFAIGLERVWLDERFRVPMTDRERTVLDLFAHTRQFGGVGEGIATLQHAVPTLDVERLVDYAARWRSEAVARRLGWALERAGAPGEALAPLLPSLSSSYSVLDPGAPRRGRRDRRWRLIVNLAGGDTGG